MNNFAHSFSYITTVNVEPEYSIQVTRSTTAIWNMSVIKYMIMYRDCTCHFTRGLDLFTDHPQKYGIAVHKKEKKVSVCDTSTPKHNETYSKHVFLLASCSVLLCIAHAEQHRSSVVCAVGEQHVWLHMCGSICACVNTCNPKHDK